MSVPESTSRPTAHPGAGRLLFGAAYYDEYTPASAGPDRLERDMEMMQAAGFTTIRIAEFTWGTWNPAPGVFDFTHIDRTLTAAAAHGIDVIIGTPTAAVPTWLVSRHPEVLADTHSGPASYGPRQNMDITAPAYRRYGEAAIRALAEHTAPHPAVIGFQLDNETKYYDALNTNTIQRAFVDHLKERFGGDLDALNAAYGLNYWSNRISTWEDFPDVRATINGSLGCAFDAFRRGIVADFLAWQRAIVDEYRRADQFVTHNFDYDWRGYSFGLQHGVNHFKAADAVTLAGVDIYHPGEDQLTGKEIAFGGDVSRSLKNAPYLVLETQAQGQMGWLPYPGQLRLQGYSHLASGALGVMYWHYGSLHNSFETYWKGLVSQDYTPNPTYREACVLGREMREHAAELALTAKHSRVAVMVSNEAATALEWFSLDSGFPRALSGGGAAYNDVLRLVYDALYELNLEVDIVPADASAERLSRYGMVAAPALYTMSEQTTAALRAYVRGGGHLLTTFRTGVADEHVQVVTDRQPHGLSGLLGAGTDQLTRPDGVRLAPAGDLAAALGADTDLSLSHVMELLVPLEAPSGDTDAPTGTCGQPLGGLEAGGELEVLATYDHHAWNGPAIVTRRVGEGEAAGSVTYLATWPSAQVVRGVVGLVAQRAGVTDWAQDLAGQVTVRRGTNARGRDVTYLLRYSHEPVTLTLPVSGTDVLGTTGQAGVALAAGQQVTLPGWGVLVLESEQD